MPKRKVKEFGSEDVSITPGSALSSHMTCLQSLWCPKRDISIRTEVRSHGGIPFWKREDTMDSVSSASRRERSGCQSSVSSWPMSYAQAEPHAFMGRTGVGEQTAVSSYHALAITSSDESKNYIIICLSHFIHHHTHDHYANDFGF